MALKPETKAERLLTKRIALEDEITQRKKEHHIDQLEVQLEQVKNDLTAVMVEYEIEQVEGEYAHATLIRASYGGMFIATEADYRELDEIPKDRKLIPLRRILKRKFKDKDDFTEIWNRVTRRVVDVNAVEEVVAEGLLTVDEIAPAYIERQKKPYARVFRDAS